jgi:O-antigen/teichoic acid export membrane protein
VQGRKVFGAVALVAVLGFLILSKPLVSSVLPPKYEMTGWMLQALGIRVALDTFAAPGSALLMAYGKTQYSARASTLRLILMALGIWLSFSYFGLREAILSLLVAQAISYFPMIWGLTRVVPAIGFLETWTYTAFLTMTGLAGVAAWKLL